MTKLGNFLRALSLAAFLWPAAALAQSGCPTIINGAVLTAGQWNACFAAKQNNLGYTPVNRAGDIMQGPLIMAASNSTAAGFNLPPGAAPSLPNNGDVWTTTAGMFVRINGVTVGPLASATSAGFAGTSPITVSFPAGVVTYAFNFAIANTFTAAQTVKLNAGATPTPIVDAALVVVGNNNAVARIQLDSFNQISAFTGAVYGGTAASPTAVTSGMQLTGINAYAYNGAALVGPIVSFRTYAAENIASGHQGTKACIATTVNATTTLVDNFCVNNDGTIFTNAPFANSITVPAMYVGTGGFIQWGNFTYLQSSADGSFQILPQVAANRMLIGVATATTLPSGGNAGLGMTFSATPVGLYVGTGAPTLSAAQGSIYLRNDGTPYYNTNGTTGWATIASAASAITSLTGDVTGTGPGATATTLATVASAGTTGSSTAIPVITINAKGLTTSITTAAVIAPAGTLTGATLASNVLASSLTSVGTLTGGATGAGFTVALTTSTVTGNLPIANAPSIAANTVIGSIAGGTAAALTKTQTTTLINTFTTSLSGAVPAPGSVAGNVLSDNGTWIAPTSGGTVTSVVCGATTITTSGTCPTIAVVKVQHFSATGTYTPSTGLVYAIIECLGAGGGGGSADVATGGYNQYGGGGGAGGYSRAVASAATIGASQAVTIGAAGTGGAAGNNAGVAGGDTSVGTLCVGKGGTGGGASTGTAQGNGGAGGATGTGNMVAGRGMVGFTGFPLAFAAGAGPSAPGASSAWGSGAVPCNGQTNQAGGNATGFGAGGGGGCNYNSAVLGAAGGNASAGYIVITEYTNQ